MLAMFMSRTVLFYAAPPVVLGTLFTVYHVWFSGNAVEPEKVSLPTVGAEQPVDPVRPFGGSGDRGGAIPPKPKAGSSAHPPAVTAAEEPVEDLVSATRLVQKLAAELYAAFPEAAQWAKFPDAIVNAVAAVDCIALGGSPRRQLPFLVPTKPFQAKQTADGWVIDPASYARYDRMVGVFCAGDAAKVAAAYQRLEPAIELAYSKLGYGDKRFREVLARAAGELLAVPVPAGPVQVVPGGRTYAYADPALQAQNEARKHLLRTGPENIRKVQARIRALAAALKFEVVSP
jgi:hypothetical protein